MFDIILGRIFGNNYDFSGWEKVWVAKDGGIRYKGDNLNVPGYGKKDYTKAVLKAAKSKNPPPNFILVNELPDMLEMMNRTHPQ